MFANPAFTAAWLHFPLLSPFLLPLLHHLSLRLYWGHGESLLFDKVETDTAAALSESGNVGLLKGLLANQMMRRKLWLSE